MIHHFEGFIIKEVDNKFYLYSGERLVGTSASLEDAKELAELETTWLDYQLSKINS